VDTRKEIKDFITLMAFGLLFTFLALLTLDTLKLPLWISIPIGVLAGIAFDLEKGKQEKAKKEREDALAVAMHKQEVELRLAADQKPAEPPHAPPPNPVTP
jgi:hypothetical protein